MLQRIQLPNGIDLAYLDVGAGPAIVLVHGHPLDYTMWQPQVKILALKYRVIVPELRGYGQTPLPAGVRVTLLDDFAEDILALTRLLGIERFVIAGLSLGGQVVLETYRQAPERVRGLVVADSYARMDTPEQKRGRLDQAGRFDREGFGDFAAETMDKMISPTNNAAHPELARLITKMVADSNPAGAAAALRGRAERRDYIPLLREIQAPTLIIVGRDDAFAPVPMAEEMHRGIPGSRLEIIENSGHMTNLEQPEKFNAVLTSFLDSLPS